MKVSSILIALAVAISAGCSSTEQSYNIEYNESMVWWPEEPPTKLSETEPGTYSVNQIVRPGEPFPKEYLNADE